MLGSISIKGELSVVMQTGHILWKLYFNSIQIFIYKFMQG